jgi:putative protease
LLGRVQKLQQVQTRDGKYQLTLQLSLTEQVAVGDRLRLHDEFSGERISFTLRNLQVGGHKQKAARAGQKIQLSLYAKLRGRGNKMFRGSLFKVDVGSRISAERTGRERRKKLSDRKVLPDKRRVEEILGHLCWKRGRVDLDQYPRGKRPGKKGGLAAGRRDGRRELPYWVAISGFSDLKGRLPVRAARIIVPLNLENMQRAGQLGGKIKKYQSKLVWRLPPVVNESDVSRYGKHVRKLVAAGYTRFELSHVSQYGLFYVPDGEKQEQQLELYGHYTLNLLNSAALQAAKHLHLKGVLFSLETEGENFAAAIAHFKRQGGRGKAKQSLKAGCYVYGRPPLFTARLDSDHYIYQQPFLSPKEEEFTLKQRDGFTFAHSALPFSLLKWRSELASMGVDYLVIDLTGGPFRQESDTVSSLLGSGGRRMSVLSGNFQGTLV